MGFPACHVWWHQRVNPTIFSPRFLTHHCAPGTFQPQDRIMAVDGTLAPWWSFVVRNLPKPGERATHGYNSVLYVGWNVHESMLSCVFLCITKNVVSSMWENLTTTSLFSRTLEMMVSKGNHPQHIPIWPWFRFRLVNYCDLLIYPDGYNSCFMFVFKLLNDDDLKMHVSSHLLLVDL